MLSGYLGDGSRLGSGPGASFVVVHAMTYRTRVLPMPRLTIRASLEPEKDYIGLLPNRARLALTAFASSVGLKNT